MELANHRLYRYTAYEHSCGKSSVDANRIKSSADDFLLLIKDNLSDSGKGGKFYEATHIFVMGFWDSI